MIFNDVMLEEFDEIVISGVSSSPSGVKFDGLKCTIATLDNDDIPAIKVWPDDQSKYDKIWFLLCKVSKLEVINKADD